MMRKRRTLTTLLLLVVLTGCSSKTNQSVVNDKTATNTENDTTEDIPATNDDGNEHITKELSDNLYIDADVQQPSAKEYAVYSVTNKIFDKNDLDMFLQEDDTDRTFSELPYQPQTLIVDTGKGSSLLMGDGSIIYQKDAARDAEIESTIEGYLLFNKDNEDTTELPFQSKEDAIALGADKIKEVSNCQVEAVRAVGISHEHLARILDDLSKSEIYQTELKNGSTKKIGNVSDADDLYYIEYAIKVDDLRLYNAILEPDISMNIEAFWNNRVNVTAVISQDGIRYFNFNGVYDSLDNAKEKKPIITATEVLQKVEEQYNNIILTDKNTISKVWLEYVPVPTSWSDPSTIELRPYWCIQLDIMVNDQIASTAKRINAITGGNLANGE